MRDFAAARSGAEAFRRDDAEVRSLSVDQDDSMHVSERATRVELVINLKTAKALGVIVAGASERRHSVMDCAGRG